MGFCWYHRHLSSASKQKVNTHLACFIHSCTHMLIAQRERLLLNISHITNICAFAGLEGAKATSWKLLAASEKVAVAYAFIHEEDGRLALKFLARVMASYGGSQGEHLSWHTLTRALDVRQQQAQQAEAGSPQMRGEREGLKRHRSPDVQDRAHMSSHARWMQAVP